MTDKTDNEEAILKELLPEIDVIMGHPNDPDRGSLRSVEDEKRIDAEGKPIVDGLPWSEAKTGLYLMIAISRGGLMVDRLIKGCQAAAIPGGDHYMTVGVTEGLATAVTPFAGASLELPSDLAQDSMKRKYVAEWVAETAVEALQLTGSAPKDDEAAGAASRMSSVGLWVSAAAEHAIVSLGL